MTTGAAADRIDAGRDGTAYAFQVSSGLTAGAGCVAQSATAVRRAVPAVGKAVVDAGAGAGADTMEGGAGHDTADYRDRAAAVSVTLDLQRNDGTIGAAENDLVGLDVEAVTGGRGADRLAGDDNALTGGPGAHAITGGDDNAPTGGPGAHAITGGGGGDKLSGDTGADALDGGAGNDYLDDSRRLRGLTPA